MLACGARLLDPGFFRAGGQACRRTHDSYGLTTLLRDHVTCSRQEIHISYPGKSGKDQNRTPVDPAAYSVIASLLRRRDDRPQLLAYWRGGDWHDIQTAELNEYLRRGSGADLAARDFRTWHATVLAAVALAVSAGTVGETEVRRRRAVVRAVREVSVYLGNTPAVCRASYISPRIVELGESGTTIAPVLDALGQGTDYGQPATRGVMEKAVCEPLA
ncbi:hypothetical protein AB0D54_34195 [Streptomyces xanthophaeus]|uniref:hypothetical protein n=1 Tax=Streptomyces xanthophaeus TaxID=67385 RepID=UPI00342ED013